MMVDVRMKDGLTTLRLKQRADLTRLTRRHAEKLDDERPVRLWAAWSLGDAKGPTFEPTQLMFIQPNSIAFVRKVEAAEREAFEQQFPDAAARAAVRPETPAETPDA